MAKAWKIPDFSSKDKLPVGLSKILKTRLQEAFSLVERVKQDREIEAVHSMRISLRRIIVTLKIFRELIPEKRYGKLYLRIKNILDQMGKVRELDVLIEEVEKYVLKIKGPEGNAFHLFIAQAKAERKIAAGGMLKEIDLQEKEGLLAEYIMTADNLV